MFTGRSPRRRDARYSSERPIAAQTDIADAAGLSPMVAHRLPQTKMGGGGGHTDLLEELRSGHREALDRITVLVYDELREIAHRHRLARGRDGSLATTALVHEAYLKLVDQSRARWNDRAHFLALAAVAMRHILADRAKARSAEKRGGKQVAVTLDEDELESGDQPGAFLQLDDALRRLEQVDPRLSRVVECRFFGGMTDDEIAEALGVTARTVQRDWVKARMLLRDDLTA